MVKMNSQLTQCKMLAGENLSVVDFIVYCEIYQVLAMYERTLPLHLTKLHEWYDNMSEIEAIKEVNKRLNSVLDRLELRESTQTR